MSGKRHGQGLTGASPGCQVGLRLSKVGNLKRKVVLLMIRADFEKGFGGGLVVRVLAFYSDDSSFIPTEVQLITF